MHHPNADSSLEQRYREAFTASDEAAEHNDRPFPFILAVVLSMILWVGFGLIAIWSFS